MTKLVKPFEKVKDGNRIYYGGRQQWCSKKLLRDSGCGVIACAQILFHIAGKNRASIEKKEFMELAELLGKKYLFVIKGLGLSGILMSWGLNRYLRKKKLPYRARWGCMPWKIWQKTEEMLKADIPVILAVGANFPIIRGRHKINLYDKRKEGYVTVDRISAHFVTITDMDEEWIGVSSWGSKYYINKKEYIRYVILHSNWILSNILVFRTFDGQDKTIKNNSLGDFHSS